MSMLTLRHSVNNCSNVNIMTPKTMPQEQLLICLLEHCVIMTSVLLYLSGINLKIYSMNQQEQTVYFAAFHVILVVNAIH